MAVINSPRSTTLNKELFSLANHFRSFIPWSLDPAALGPAVEQGIMTGAYGQGKLLISCHPERRGGNWGGEEREEKN